MFVSTGLPHYFVNVVSFWQRNHQTIHLGQLRASALAPVMIRYFFCNSKQGKHQEICTVQSVNSGLNQEIYSVMTCSVPDQAHIRTRTSPNRHTIMATFTCVQCFRVGLAQLVGVSSSKLELPENDLLPVQQSSVVKYFIIKYFNLIIAGL